MYGWAQSAEGGLSTIESHSLLLNAAIFQPCLSHLLSQHASCFFYNSAPIGLIAVSSQFVLKELWGLWSRSVESLCGVALWSRSVESLWGVALWSRSGESLCGVALWSRSVESLCGVALWSRSVESLWGVALCGVALWSRSVESLWGVALWSRSVESLCGVALGSRSGATAARHFSENQTDVWTRSSGLNIVFNLLFCNLFIYSTSLSLNWNFSFLRSNMFWPVENFIMKITV